MPDRLVKRSQRLYHGLKALWNYWALSIGSLAALTVLSPVLPAKFMPLLSMAIVFVLMILDRKNRAKQIPDCFKLPFEIIVVLTLTAFLMAITLLINPDAFGSPFPTSHTPNPLFTILLLGPSSIIVSLYYILRGGSASYCKSCMSRRGDSMDRGFIGSIYYAETTYQCKLFLAISVIISVVTWGYYLFFYIDININKSDKYFLTAFPVAVYLFTLAYLWLRYSAMKRFYMTDTEMRRQISRESTRLRYLLISDNRILIGAKRDIDIDKDRFDDPRMDTPAIINLPLTRGITLDKARSLLIDHFGLRNPEVHYLYETHDFDKTNNVYHYIVHLTSSDEIDFPGFEYQWITYSQLREFVNNDMVSTPLARELKRITTIAITAKTYDYNGHRKHPVRHYRPTFKLNDLFTVDVDYNDNRWLTVNAVNADSRLYHLRRLWSRLAKGTGKWS